MKHYTTIEQSKKLLELGLSPESADFEYKCVGFTMHTARPTDDFKYKVMLKEQNIPHEPKYDVPCWSLGALLEVMPDEIKVDGTNCNLYIAKDFISYEGWDRCDTSTTIQPMGFYDKPFIELLFEAICWLLEKGFIKDSSTK